MNEQIGPYRILSTLGEGGMGVVYLAEQSEPVRREVALKVLKPGADSEQVLARFDVERQALAVMDHPAIAKVFDAGVTEDGRSYFAMEMVRGESLTDFADAHRLTIRARVRLFVDVCKAVQHAHQKGIIHRDLKPSNVLVSEVDGRPAPRIIDFGIAKATQAEAFDGTQLTRDDQTIGTPAYMSPEQIDGSADVDTRTDVYALGVLLFETLVGSLPYDAKAYRGWAAVAAQLHREPPTPSKRLEELTDREAGIAEARTTTPVLLRRVLSGDLSWIVAKAMEKDRDDRYETANAIALDLERFLSHEAIRARGANTAYVVRKFVRRNRAGVSFGAVVFLGLIAFSVVTSVQADRIARARDETDARRGQAEGLIDFMLTDLRGKLEPIGRLEILDDVGAQAADYFSKIPEEQFSDAELASRSQALYQIGSVRLDQGAHEAAVQALAESLRLARALSDRAPEDPDRLFGLSQSHFWVGFAAWRFGDLETAEAEFDGYLDAALRLVEIDPENPDYRMELGYAHSNLGTIREERGDLAAAIEAYGRTLGVKEELVALDPTNIGWLGELAETHNTLAVAYRRTGEFGRAREEHQTELDLKRQLLELSPEQAYWRFRLGMAFAFLAQLQVLTGEVPAGMSNAYQALHVLDSLSASDPTNVNWGREAAFAGRRVGLLAAYSGNAVESRTHFAGAIARMERMQRTDSIAFPWERDMAEIRTDQARALLMLDAPAEALRVADQGRSLVAASGASGRVRMRDEIVNALVRGHALAATEDLDGARTEWSAVVDRLEREREGAGFDEFRPWLTEALLGLGRVDAAEVELGLLVERGYGEPTLMDLATATGAALNPAGGR